MRESIGHREAVDFVTLLERLAFAAREDTVPMSADEVLARLVATWRSGRMDAQVLARAVRYLAQGGTLSPPALRRLAALRTDHAPSDLKIAVAALRAGAPVDETVAALPATTAAALARLDDGHEAVHLGANDALFVRPELAVAYAVLGTSGYPGPARAAIFWERYAPASPAQRAALRRDARDAEVQRAILDQATTASAGDRSEVLLWLLIDASSHQVRRVAARHLVADERWPWARASRRALRHRRRTLVSEITITLLEALSERGEVDLAKAAAVLGAALGAPDTAQAARDVFQAGDAKTAAAAIETARPGTDYQGLVRLALLRPALRADPAPLLALALPATLLCLAEVTSEDATFGGYLLRALEEPLHVRWARTQQVLAHACDPGAVLDAYLDLRGGDLDAASAAIVLATTGCADRHIEAIPLPLLETMPHSAASSRVACHLVSRLSALAGADEWFSVVSPGFTGTVGELLELASATLEERTPDA